jgi:hypothetical protein
MDVHACKRCGDPEGESKAWHESVTGPGDLDLIQYKGELWHRKCAADDKATEADSKRLKRDVPRRSWGR